jgi:hypothetical protein
MNEIYKITISLYNSQYRIRTEKLQCKETKSLYLVDYGSKRLKKSKLGVVDVDTINNSVGYIRYTVYIEDIKEQEKYIKMLKEKVKLTIEEYKKNLTDLENKFNEMPLIEFRNCIEEE